MSKQPGDPHGAHDRTLISAAVAGDLAGSELARADARMADCPGCASLAADLRSIAAATRSLPARSLGAGRDFRLSPATAGRLRREGGWRRFLGGLSGRSGSPRLAGALTTLGIAGLLLSTLPGISLPLGTGAPTENRAVDQAGDPTGPTGPSPSVASTSSAGYLSMATDNAPKSVASLGPLPPAATSIPATSGPASGAGGGSFSAGAIGGAGGASPPGATQGQGAGGPIGPAVTARLDAQNSASGEKTPTAAPALSMTAAARAALILVSMLLLAAGVGILVLRRVARRGL